MMHHDLAMPCRALPCRGAVPSKPKVALSDSDEDEPEPDKRIQIPTNKVKYVVGPGGVKIQEIQKKSKARIQVLKVKAGRGV